MTAPQLSGKKIGVIADSLTVSDILTAATKNIVRLVPQLFGNDRRNDFAGFILEHHPFFWRKKFLLFCKHINDLDLVTDIVALIFRVGDYAGQRRVRDFFTVVVSLSHGVKDILKLLQTVFISGIAPIKLAYHRCLFFVYDKSFVVFSVTEDAAVSKYDL